MMNLDKDELILRRRLLEQANTAYTRGICICTDFLNLNEQNIFTSLKHELPMIKYFAYGGFSDAERKILCFCGNDSVVHEEDINFPISCIKVVPLNQKFSDSLNHRDFLGAVLNLGLDRSKVGDILINENEGYLFSHTGISGFIVDQLVKVKHTMVSTSIIDRKDFDYKPNFQEVVGTVSSTRLDSILSVAFHSSRSGLTSLIEGGKVAVGGKIVLSNSYTLKENDVVSVRGLGKFIFSGTTYQTKKGRYSVKILLYTT
jgi:RNA-binding protein YlmH